jgi:UDP-N-acetylenolpyruvoylglucosamine reductase
VGYSSGKDVMDLIKIIKSKVKEKYKRELELEIITFE